MSKRVHILINFLHFLNENLNEIEISICKAIRNKKDVNHHSEVKSRRNSGSILITRIILIRVCILLLAVEVTQVKVKHANCIKTILN